MLVLQDMAVTRELNGEAVFFLPSKLSAPIDRLPRAGLVCHSMSISAPKIERSSYSRTAEQPAMRPSRRKMNKKRTAAKQVAGEWVQRVSDK